MIIPELLQKDAESQNIYNTIHTILKDKTRSDAMINKLGLLKNKLGTAGAAKRAAEVIYSFIDKAI